MVLHYLPSPADAVREMARALKPGGSVVLVDFVRHSHEWMRQELGVAWLGFERAEIAAWCAEAGLVQLQQESFEGRSGARDLPATFIASARKPRP
jgi:ubiquinone/menaquinone biosynthesis C-methylase UbiE